MEKTSALDAIRFEYRPDVKRVGKPQLRTRKQMRGLQGFISIYGFDEEASQYIQETGGTWGMEQAKLYSDILYIDIDKDAKLIEEVRDKLCGMGIGFTEYESGSPHSAHFHIPIEPMFDSGIQYVQKQWVKDNIGTEVDLSIYKTSGIIRLIGSYHKKHAGKKKRKVLKVTGKSLDLNGYETDVTTGLPKVAYFDDSDVDYEAVMNSLLMDKAGEGSRNNEVFRRAIVAKDAGWDMRKTVKAMEAWNSTMVSPPVRNRELIRTIQSAYRRFK